MPTLGVNTKVTLSTKDTRSNIVDFYRGISVEDVQLLPFSYLEPGKEKSYPLDNVSFILFIGDVYDKSNPFNLTLVTNNIIPSNNKDEDKDSSDKDNSSPDESDNDGNQYVSEDMWDISHGNNIPGSKDSNSNQNTSRGQEDFANLIKIGRNLEPEEEEEPYDPENDPEDLEDSGKDGEGNGENQENEGSEGEGSEGKDNKDEEEKPSSIPSTPLIPATGNRPSVPATSLTPAYPRYKEVLLEGCNFLLVNASNFKEFRVTSTAKKATIGYKLLLG